MKCVLFELVPVVGRRPILFVLAHADLVQLVGFLPSVLVEDIFVGLDDQLQRVEAELLVAHELFIVKLRLVEDILALIVPILHGQVPLVSFSFRLQVL